MRTTSFTWKACRAADNHFQYARTLAIQKALQKAQAASPRENAPKLGQIRSLGLIGKDEESKKFLEVNS